MKSEDANHNPQKHIKFWYILVLQFVVVLYTLSGVLGKIAAGHPFLSPKFILFYGLEILILGVYAILWQQVIKQFDLSIAYANRSLALLWSMMWAVLLFHEAITLQNVIGIIIVIAGTLIVNGDMK